MESKLVTFDPDGAPRGFFMGNAFDMQRRIAALEPGWSWRQLDDTTYRFAHGLAVIPPLADFDATA